MISWKMEMVGGKWLATLKLEASGMFHCREMGVLCLHRLGKNSDPSCSFEVLLG